MKTQETAIFHQEKLINMYTPLPSRKTNLPSKSKDHKETVKPSPLILIDPILIRLSIAANCRASMSPPELSIRKIIAATSKSIQRTTIIPNQVSKTIDKLKANF